MAVFIDCMSTFFENILLYIYFQTMFRQRKNISPWLVVAIFAVYDIVFTGISRPLLGDTSYPATIFRTLFTAISYFLISYLFYSSLLKRILVVFSYSMLIGICELLSYYVISHFADTTSVLDKLPDTTFTSISLFSDIILLLINMILHIIIKKKEDVRSNKYSFLLLLVPILSCIMEASPTFFRLNETQPSAYLTLTVFLLIICITNYVLLQSVLRAESLEWETELLSNQIELQERKYQQLGDSYKNIRSFLHDTKKHLFYIESCVNEEQYDRIIPYSRKMVADLEKRYCTINTGNLVIDAFVSDLVLQTKNRHIKLLTSIRVEKDRVPCDDYHLAIILGNLIDNALTACKEEINAEINLKIQTVEHVFAIYITNTFHAPKNQNRLKSTEEPDFIHGYGLKNIENSAETCGGFCQINYTDNIYSVAVIIPQKGQNESA